ncbi:HAD-like domain-containing protein [Trichoderma sp. SZMC 28012]
MATTRPITSFKALTFDCYGTLVDWESGIYNNLQPLNQQLADSHPLKNNRLGLLKALVRHEGLVQTANPTYLYHAVLAAAYGNLAAELGVSADEEAKSKFGFGVGDWTIYPDTLEALKRLHKHYKLVILSNVDLDSFKRTLEKQFQGFPFDAIYTAQEIGSYKPDLNNFRYLIEHCDKDLGVEKENILHTAQSLHHDHVPAAQIGLTSVWIERGEEVESVMGGDPEAYADKVSYSWKFTNMKEMADAVDAAAKNA